MILEINTDSVPLADRPDYWCQSHQNLFKDNCQVSPDPSLPFQASMSLVRVGPLTLSDRQGTSFEMIRQDCSEPENLELLIQKEGVCEIHHRNSKTLLGPGHFCIFPANSQIGFGMRGNFRQLSLRFRASYLSTRFLEWEQKAFSSIACNAGAGGLFLGLVRAMRQHGGATNNECCVVAFQAMLGLLAAALREQRMDESPLPATRMASYHKTRIRSFVLENLSNPDLDIPRIASAMGLSRRYLHRLFTDEPMQLMHWVWSERLERCLIELTRPGETNRSVSAVAYSWGFNDASHFSRSFRKRYGVSPRDAQSDYQRAHLVEKGTPG